MAFIAVDGAGEGIYTTPLGEADVNSLNQLSGCPVLLQERVEKIADVRITVVGQRLFSAIIWSTPMENDAVDFREMHEDKIDCILVPTSLERAILDLTKEMDLKFAALDFGLTSRGEYIFFEANVTGNWLWIEQATGLQISREIAGLLARL